MNNTNKELKKITAGFLNDYSTSCNQSRSAAINRLKPGQPTPQAGVIYGDEYRAEFAKKAEQWKAEAIALIDKEGESVKHKMTEAPSAEALRSIQLLSLRSDITKNDIDNLMDVFGDNPQCYDALANIARQNGINEYMNPHPVKVRYEEIEGLKASISKEFNLDRAENGHATPGFIAFLDSCIDGVFEPAQE